MQKINNVFVADFETNTDPERASVWAWDLCSIQTYEHLSGTNIELFFETLGSLVHECIVVYFHNLKFDGTFILCYLLKQNLKYVKSDDFNFDEGTFSCIVDSMKKFYSISVKVNGVKIEFRDSLKKIPSSVDNIAKSFELDLNKLSIDYNIYRDPYSHVLTDDEAEYIMHDTEIIARVLNQFYINGMDYLTLSSDCFNLYKKQIGKDAFDIAYPVLSNATDRDIRRAYFGGICYANKTGVDLHNVMCYDVNSMYPSIMYNCFLPFGIPAIHVGRPYYKENHLYILHIKIALNVKKDFLPFYMKSGGIFFQNEFVKNTEGEMLEIWITNVELELVMKHYDYDVEYIDYLEFKASKKLFKNYIEPIYQAKCIDTGAKKQLDKFKLNMLYGRFGLNPLRVSATPYLEEGVLKFKNDTPKYVAPVYTAIAVFVTAHARIKLVNAIQENYENFVYCDTDSIFLTAEAKGIEIHDNKLGAWKLEKTFDTLRVIGAKTYCGILDNGKKLVKVCGAPGCVKDAITLDNFVEGLTLSGKLIPKNVKGGVVLKDTDFTIKARNKRF